MAAFTGGKRIFATRIGNRMVDLAKAGREEAGATLQSELVETYYALRLAQRVVDVREQTFLGLQKHYRNAMKLEKNGMINKAERLFAQVTMDEARRELESARKDLNVAQNALKVLLNVEDATSINPSSPLFMNHDLPDELYFKNLVSTGNYIVSKLRIQEVMADNQLKSVKVHTSLPLHCLESRHFMQTIFRKLDAPYFDRGGLYLEYIRRAEP